MGEPRQSVIIHIYTTIINPYTHLTTEQGEVEPFENVGNGRDGNVTVSQTSFDKSRGLLGMSTFGYAIRFHGETSHHHNELYAWEG